MKIGLIQCNSKVGDLSGNAGKIIKYIQKYQEEVDLIVFPELSLLGYPPLDLLFNQKLIADSLNLLNNQIIPQTRVSTLIGLAYPALDGKLYNSLALIENYQLKRVFHKKLLANYEVFHEKRYFTNGQMHAAEDLVIKIKNYGVAILVCEDLLNEHTERELTPEKFLAQNNLQPDLIVCASASPYRVGQPVKRVELANKFLNKFKCGVALVNQVGANDDLIFDGSSFILENGQVAQMAQSFSEDVLIHEINSKTHKQNFKEASELAEIEQALVLGIRDYFQKNGFQRAILGLSGGIDSALVAALAVKALGAANVFGVLMPSNYSSEASLQDAQTLAKNLEIATKQFSIQNLLNHFLHDLNLQKLTLTEENLQARIRGNILMALAAEQRALVLATGNKTELAVGYSTIYGDMCGAIAPIGDLWKTKVWQLANTIQEIPKQIIQKPPSAELSPGQLDSDSLPDYYTLDEILQSYLVNNLSIEEIIENGYSSELVNKVIKMLHISEFKRKQAPIILKISHNAFGSGWLYPVAADCLR